MSGFFAGQSSNERTLRKDGDLSAACRKLAAGACKDTCLDRECFDLENNLEHLDYSWDFLLLCLLDNFGGMYRGGNIYRNRAEAWKVINLVEGNQTINRNFALGFRWILIMTAGKPAPKRFFRSYNIVVKLTK